MSSDNKGSTGTVSRLSQRFGSSEVNAARATQDRIELPEFQEPNLLPDGDISPDRFLDRELSWL
ncbi:MAG: hypothetical protein J7474_13600, partial [Arthrobacter sp.]|nr:hypothetical protein [Arthrobacter sp.]